MADPKYKKYFNEMWENHRDQMLKFMLLNQDYRADRVKHKDQFDLEGQEIQKIVEDWTNRLCHTMEKGQHSAYSNKLGDKFLGEVTKYFPCYHEIGVKIKRM